VRKRIVVEDADNGFIVEKHYYTSDRMVFKTLEELLEYVRCVYSGYVEEE